MEYITIAFAIKGDEADITDLYECLNAMQNKREVNSELDSLSWMFIDGECYLRRVSPTCLRFDPGIEDELYDDHGELFLSVRQALSDAYPRTDIFFYLSVDEYDYPFVYDPEHLLKEAYYSEYESDNDAYYKVDSNFPLDDDSWTEGVDLVHTWTEADSYDYVIEYEATYADGVKISGSFGREWAIDFGDLDVKEVFLNDLDETYLNGMLYEAHDDDSTLVWEVGRDSDAVRLGIEKSDFDCYDDWCEAVDDRRCELEEISTLKLSCTDKAGSSTTIVIHTVHEFKENTPLSFSYEVEVGSKKYAGELAMEYDDSDEAYYSAEAAYFLRAVGGKEIKDSEPEYVRFFDTDDCDPVGRIYGAILEETGLEEIEDVRLSYIGGGC